MNYIEALKKEDILLTTTENGDIAFASSGSFCLDFFALAGGMRYNYQGINNLFIRSYYEDKILTLKIMLYLRDVLNGLGERNSFRMTFNLLSNLNPKLARQLLPIIPKYGRWDDILSGLSTPIEGDVVKLIEVTLDEDLIKYNQNQEISLLSKWLPSINTSNKDAKLMAKRISNKLGYTPEEYRKLVSKLRKGRIIENKLRKKDYTFDYSKVPSQAILKYSKAFIRNDQDRFKDFIAKVRNNKAKINIRTISTSQISHGILKDKSILVDEFQDVAWNALERKEFVTRTIVVRDGSSSMLWGQGPITPMDIATSIAIFAAEQLPKPFKNHFITFSENPRLIEIPEGTISEKVKYVETFDEVANTNISKVYELLLNVAKKNKVGPNDMIEQVIIISDMQFDECVTGESTFNTYKNKFEEIGLKMPQLVFWNVSARNIQVPITQNELGVKLVSGSSQKILENIIANKIDQTAYDFMIEDLKRYSEVDKFEI
ncbi:MAG: DUF2828 family protein [Acholeplasmataceae bacterium]|jgi:hypothetical protein